MNTKTKVLLTINGIEGATLHRREFKTTKKGRTTLNYEKTSVDCFKSLKLTQEAYVYMTSKEKPEWYYKKDWLRLKPIARLELHLARICEHNGGKSFAYNILEDE